VRRAAAAVLFCWVLGCWVLGAAGCGMTIAGYGLNTAGKYVLPECCVSVWRDYEADSYDEAQQASHPSEVEAFDEHQHAALDKASLESLRADLAALSSSAGSLRPPLAPSDLDARLGDARLSDEALALYLWHDGQQSCDEGQALLFSHCLLPLDEALRMKAEDREMFLGTPERWHPLLSFAGEVLYVLAQDKPVAATPVLWVSLLSPVDAVAFTNVRTMVQTHVAWRAESLWPPEALDEAQRARFEAVHRELNPGAQLPW
jgi:hypothetical protein